MWYVCVSVCVCACGVSTGAYGDQRRVLHPLELELQAVTSYLMWLLGTEHGSSARVACTLNSWASSPALLELFLGGINIETSPYTSILSKVQSRKPEGRRIICILSESIGKLHQNHHEIPWEFQVCCYWSPRRQDWLGVGIEVDTLGPKRKGRKKIVILSSYELQRRKQTEWSWPLQKILIWEDGHSTKPSWPYAKVGNRWFCVVSMSTEASGYYFCSTDVMSISYKHVFQTTGKWCSLSSRLLLNCQCPTRPIEFFMPSGILLASDT